MPFPQSADK